MTRDLCLPAGHVASAEVMPFKDSRSDRTPFDVLSLYFEYLNVKERRNSAKVKTIVSKYESRPSTAFLNARMLL